LLREARCRRRRPALRAPDGSCAGRKSQNHDWESIGAAREITLWMLAVVHLTVGSRTCCVFLHTFPLVCGRPFGTSVPIPDSMVPYGTSEEACGEKLK